MTSVSKTGEWSWWAVGGALLAVGISAGGLIASRLSEPRPLPELPPYESNWMGGGHSPDAVCAPKKQEYEAQYRDFDIGVQYFEANTKNIFGHVEYKYGCHFTAKPK